MQMVKLQITKGQNARNRLILGNESQHQKSQNCSFTASYYRDVMSMPQAKLIINL